MMNKKYNVPANAKIPNTVRVLGNVNSCARDGKVFVHLDDGDKLKSPLPGDQVNMLKVVPNLFTSDLKIYNLYVHNDKIVASCDISSSLRMSDLGVPILAKIYGDPLHELIMAGMICANGNLRNDTELCLMCYRGYSNLILKGGVIYNSIKPF